MGEEEEREAQNLEGVKNGRLLCAKLLRFSR